MEVSRETNSTPTDKWQPVITVKPDGTKLFIAWYDRRDDPSANSLIRVYGVFSSLPIRGTNSFATNFPISAVAFQPVFTGTNSLVGTYDPAFPPEFFDDDPRFCGSHFGANKNHMGDYDTAVADSEYVYYAWADNRSNSSGISTTRKQADIRHVRISWPP